MVTKYYIMCVYTIDYSIHLFIHSLAILLIFVQMLYSIQIYGKDPICFNLHLKDILFNFHMQRVDERVQAGKEWNNPLAMGSLIDLAGTEVRRQFFFHT
jgi:hypothetical protein